MQTKHQKKTRDADEEQMRDPLELVQGCLKSHLLLMLTSLHDLLQSFHLVLGFFFFKELMIEP